MRWARSTKHTSQWTVTEWVLDRLADFASRRRQHDSAPHERIVSDLSEAQCKDAGIDRLAARPDKPSIEIEAGLMAKLMQMR